MKNTRGTAICVSIREVKMALSADKVHVHLMHVSTNLQGGCPVLPQYHLKPIVTDTREVQVHMCTVHVYTYAPSLIYRRLRNLTDSKGKYII